jgi:predicted transcriptional regulator
MDDEKTSRDAGQELVARIVSSYVKHNTVSANDLPIIITSVHQALSGLGKPASPVEPRTPAVSVRQSVLPDYVVCLECGWRGKTLRRHLGVQHGLDRPAYYARWRLPADHPITAPGYSAQRSAMAKALGFGRWRSANTASPEPEPPPATKPRLPRPRAHEALPTESNTS